MNAVFQPIKVRQRLAGLGCPRTPVWADRAEAVRDFANIIRHLAAGGEDAPVREYLLVLEHLTDAAEAGVDDAQEHRVVCLLGRARDVARVLHRLLVGRAEPFEEEILRLADLIRDAAEAALARGDGEAERAAAAEGR